MTSVVEIPLWLFILILLFAAVTAASHLLFPSVRWFFRRRMERAVSQLNTRLERPIEPFKLARRYDMIQRLIYQPDVAKAVTDRAAENGVPENVAFEEARRYAREIVPSFSATAYFGFAIRVARLLSTSLFEVRLLQTRQSVLRDIPKDATVVFVMNHRSNMDYVLVTYLAAERSALSYAVGEWARVWPLSRLIRAMGAYFIRRDRGNALYRKVLAAYVRLATQGGVTQAMFPEGRLSLSGGPQDPKRGLLKYITEGVDPASRDVVFVPVAINYDRVLEDRILLAAKARGGKGFHARISVVAGFFLKHMWQRLLGRGNRFGTAAVSIGQPLSLREYAPDGDAAAEALAGELMGRINAIVPVLPVPLVAAIVEDAKAPLSRAAVDSLFADRVQRLDRPGATAQVVLPEGDQNRAIEEALATLTKRRMIRSVDGTFEANPDEADALAFYANSIRHLVS
ncbi:1-acyl-sn-glycerol-3-phosphate acyltransferase [Shimia abyssi]|uniref:Glycerol-3-phosphate acyltransferase n=1 Tax=Shimia abyssi TaxID=1662395 RepID=A0A2P8FKH6_9RHOB|nr:1-acyl-sn-glycerol-3-phosphate acyltransferase [Shimia abyssi]PSL22223.1 glycerol-3-phosphate acyltransferase [Shimia abyssi]